MPHYSLIVELSTVLLVIHFEYTVCSSAIRQVISVSTHSTKTRNKSLNSACTIARMERVQPRFVLLYWSTVNHTTLHHTISHRTAHRTALHHIASHHTTPHHNSAPHNIILHQHTYHTKPTLHHITVCHAHRAAHCSSLFLLLLSFIWLFCIVLMQWLVSDWLKCLF